MNMMRLNKHTYILFLTFVVIFLFGCSQQQQKKAPVDATPELSSQEDPIQEAVNEQAEQVKEAPKTTSTGQQQAASENATPELASQDVPVQEAVNEQAEQTKEVKEVSEQELSFQENPQAQQRLEFAENNLKMAQKGILSYSQAVAIFRSIIRDYPGTQYERQARTFLGQVPEDLRSQFNITDEELEL